MKARREWLKVAVFSLIFGSFYVYLCVEFDPVFAAIAGASIFMIMAAIALIRDLIRGKAKPDARLTKEELQKHWNVLVGWPPRPECFCTKCQSYRAIDAHIKSLEGAR